MTAAPRTSGCLWSRSSTSAGKMAYPLNLIMSLARSRIMVYPSCIDTGDIARVKPSVPRTVAARLVRPVEIPLHHLRPLDDQLAGVGRRLLGLFLGQPACISHGKGEGRQLLGPRLLVHDLDIRVRVGHADGAQFAMPVESGWRGSRVSPRSARTLPR